VATGHFVSGLELALYRDENLDHFHDAGLQFVAPAQLVHFVRKAQIETVLGLVVLRFNRLDLGLRLLVAQPDLPPLMPSQRLTVPVSIL